MKVFFGALAGLVVFGTVPARAGLLFPVLAAVRAHMPRPAKRCLHLLRHTAMAGKRSLLRQGVWPVSREAENVVAAYRKKHSLYLSMTTSPKRLRELGPTLASFDPATIDGLLLNLPDTFARSGERYDEGTIARLVERFPFVRVQRGFDDAGPATKLVPSLKSVEDENAILIAVDDDTLYPVHFPTELAYSVLLENAPVSCAGHNLPFWRIERDFVAARSPARPTRSYHHAAAVVEGFGGIAFKRGHLDVKLVEALLALGPECRFSDDIVFSAAFALRGHQPWVLSRFQLSILDVVQRPIGFQSDALHLGAGMGSQTTSNMNEEKYRRCFDRIEQWRLARGIP